MSLLKGLVCRFSWVLLWACLLTPVSARAETVQVFVPTNRLNPAQGRYDSLRVELKDVDLADFPALMKQMAPVLPEFDAAHPPEVPIYLSKSTPEAERLRIVREGKKRVGEAFPGLPIRYQVRYLEDVGADPASVEKSIVDSIDEAAKGFPQDADTAMAADILKKATHQLAAKSAEEIKDEMPFFSNPATARKFVEVSGVGKALVAFAGRSASLVKAGVPFEAAPILSSIALVGGDTALAYLANKYEIQIAKIMTDHPLPLPEGVLTRIQELYTSSQVAKLAKGTLGTIALWGVGVPAMWQTVGHFASPHGIQMPTGADVGVMFTTSIVSSLTYIAGVRGLENLRQKGWINQPAIDMILRANGFLWALSYLGLSTGDPTIKALVPWVMGPMWGIYGAPAALGPLLPVRNDRIVIVDGNLNNRADLNALEALESTHLVEEPGKRSQIKAAVAQVQEAKEIRNNIVQRAAGGAARWVGSLPGRCGDAWASLWKKKASSPGS